MSQFAKDIAGTKVDLAPPELDFGTYHLKVEDVGEAVSSRKEVPYFYVTAEVLASNNPTVKPGDVGSIKIYKTGFDYWKKDIARFMIAAYHGGKAGAVSAEEYEEIINGGGAGAEFALEIRHSNRTDKEGKPYKQYVFQAVTT